MKRCTRIVLALIVVQFSSGCIGIGLSSGISESRVTRQLELSTNTDLTEEGLLFSFPIMLGIPGHQGAVTNAGFSGSIVVQSKIGSMEIRLQRADDRPAVRDTLVHRPCVDPASRRREGHCHIHAAVPFLPGRRASAFSVPRGGECVFAQVMRAQVRKACANIERVVW